MVQMNLFKDTDVENKGVDTKVLKEGGEMRRLGLTCIHWYV